MSFENLVNAVVILIVAVVLVFAGLVLIGSIQSGGGESFMPAWFNDLAAQAYRTVFH